MLAAADLDGFACDVAAVVAGQEYRYRRDVPFWIT
jgi:hypothetical protein